MNLFQKLLAEFEGVSEEAWAYIKTNVVPILENDATALLTQLAPLAESAVQQAATTGKVSSAAFSAASADLKSAAAGAGLQVANSLLDYAVQTAYNKLSATGTLASAAAVAAAPVRADVPAAAGSTNANAAA